MHRRPPCTTRTDTLLPSTTHLRSQGTGGTLQALGTNDARDTTVVGHDVALGPTCSFDHEGRQEALVGLRDLRPVHLWVQELLTQGIGDKSEEHTYELQSLMRNSYAVFCLKKKKYI